MIDLAHCQRLDAAAALAPLRDERTALVQREMTRIFSGRDTSSGR